jgi:hypothetical protein
MIYDSLDIIPYKLFLKIEEVGDVSLLSDEECDVQQLLVTWEKMYEDHLTRNQSSESKKIFKLSKRIDELIAMNKVIVIGCRCLRFEYNEELVSMITGYGYNLGTESTVNYYECLDRIERESNAYVVKAEYYKGMLPEQKGENDKSEFTADDVMASYSSILGFSIGDFNKVTYNAFYGYEKQVNAKGNVLVKGSEKNR